MTEKFSKLFKQTNVITIVAYLIIYAVSFCAFDDSRTNYDEDVFEEWILELMMSVGMALTLSIITYVCVQSKNAKQAAIVSVVCNMVQIPILFYGIASAEAIKRSALYYEDSVTEFHCSVAIVMSHIIMVLIAVLLLLTICRLVFTHKKMQKNQIEGKPDNTYTKECIDKSYIHIPVICTLFATVIFCIAYVYEIAGFLIIIPFMVSFPLPAAVILSTEVRKWVEQEKYIRAAFAYIVYMYLVYGALYRLFSDELYAFAFNHNVLDLVFDNFILLVNVIVAGIVSVKLLVRAIKKKCISD